MSLVFCTILAGVSLIVEEYISRLNAWMRRPQMRRPRQYKFN